MRLDKFVCKSTAFTKTQAITSITQGDVTVNGEVITDIATQVHENNEVALSGERLYPRPFRYLLMHKPAQTICSNIDEVYPSLFNYIDIERPQELHIVGRLDADTTGLVLITDDGRWSFNIISPNKLCPKVYRVQLRQSIDESAMPLFAQGIKLQGETQLTAPATLIIVNDKQVLLTITEGKFHQVKRMFASIGNKVVGLHREAIGSVTLDVNEGQWRYLTVDEIQALGK
ncbi:16S rRNA pseudouridine(516) synthase [Photobacterium phosphoreum]|uniref:Pseudouridine synthase n=1 Tax=Photobacterium phosphoreum TaxID=659 RepID=A0A2T3JNZ6_PHOPO|nr:16S rRNA pseudouridine(516) synthase [Photobacterium phosphoreum]PSU26415.1 16S rRNA pseudouridine(516) synthase [Photobacterium phosphoreum]PSU41866.1 16S rRNA pseudouridine(516) synthase [Photobacterium phosphoreum]PSU50766.1 16S rRNA pseudouridine(516) synthase [Photobacterium phosphoreum]